MVNRKRFLILIVGLVLWITFSARIGTGIFSSPVQSEENENDAAYPEWIADPDVHVLVTVIGDKPPSKNQTVSFFNVYTGERYDINTPGSIYNLIWGRDDQGLFLQCVRGNKQKSFRVWIDSGEIREFYDSTYYHEAAPHNRQVYRITGTTGESIVNLTDTTTNEIIRLWDPYPGMYPSMARVFWAPDGEMISVMRFNLPSPSPLYPPIKTSVTIYTTDGTPYRYYDRYFFVGWAPDKSLRILYHQGYIYPPYYPAPCVLNIQTGDRKCIENIQGLAYFPYGYEWGPDSESVSFIIREDGNPGICFVDIDDGTIQCPFNGIFPEYDFIRDYGFSPDGKYLWILLDQNNSDFWVSPRIATAAADGSEFRIWGPTLSWHHSSWRPAP